jgi:predicted PurR-regulated permease PerM
MGGKQGDGRDPLAPAPGRRLFNAFELRLFRYTAVLASLVALTALIVILLWSLGWLFGTFSNLILSLSVSGILALVLYPVVGFLESRLHLPRLLAVLLLLLVLGLGVGSLIVLLVPVVVSQVVELMTVVPETLARWQEHMAVYFPEFSSMISASMESSMEESSGEEPSQPVVKETGGTLLNYLGLVVAIGFVPLFLFFTRLRAAPSAPSPWREPWPGRLRGCSRSPLRNPDRRPCVLR